MKEDPDGLAQTCDEHQGEHKRGSSWDPNSEWNEYVFVSKHVCTCMNMCEVHMVRSRRKNNKLTN